jgi:uncharacterized membrane protein HdeD (DUF308 family)
MAVVVPGSVDLSVLPPDLRSKPEHRNRHRLAQRSVRRTVMATQHALLFPHGQSPTVHTLAKNWWLTLLRGLAAVAFGIAAFAWPRLTVITLILLFAAYVLADGLFALFAAIKGREHGVPTWWLAVVGLLGVAFAGVTFFWPGVTATLLMMVIGAWALVRGIFEVIAALQLWKELEDAWLLVLSGVVSIVFGAAVLLMPGAGALALVWLIGAYAILFGLILIVLSFRLKQLNDALPH